MKLFQNISFACARPAILPRVFTNLIKHSIGSSYLQMVDIDLTDQCPCSCSFCYADAVVEQKSRLLSVNEIENIADQSRRLGAIQIGLTGGEPALRPDLDQIIAACSRHQMFVFLCSSGVGLSEKRLFKLKESGLNAIAFSLDSHLSEEHDAIRGVSGLFYQVLQYISFGRGLGIRMIVNSVATEEKLYDGSLEKIRQLCINYGAILNVTIPSPVGRWKGNEGAYLSVEAQSRLFSFLKKSSVRTDTMSGFFRPACPADGHKLSVRSDGSVYACQMLDDQFGDVKTDSLAAIWERSRLKRLPASKGWFCPAGEAGPSESEQESRT